MPEIGPLANGSMVPRAEQSTSNGSENFDTEGYKRRDDLPRRDKVAHRTDTESYGEIEGSEDIDDSEFMDHPITPPPQYLDDDSVCEDPGPSRAETSVEKARARVQQYSQYVHLMEERISLLESKIQRMDASGDRPKSLNPSMNGLQMPTIPELQFVKWFDFKHKYADDKHVYAIEVLMGSARFFYQYKEDESIRKYVARGGVYENDLLPAAQSWLKLLPKIGQLVFLRPYKLFVHYEQEIRDYLRRLEEKWAHANINQINKSATRDGGSPHSESNGVAEVPAIIAASGSVGSEERRADEFEDLVESYEALCDLKCLIRFMDMYLTPIIERFQKGLKKKIHFEELWYLFKPGDELYAPRANATVADVNDTADANQSRRPYRYQSLWRVLHVAGGRPALTADEYTKPLLESQPHDFTLTCYYVDHNGRTFGPSFCFFHIKPFESAIDITALEIYPLRYANEATSIRQRGKEAGEKFVEFLEAKHIYYDGNSLTHHPCGRPLTFANAPPHPERIEGHVIVGFEEVSQMEPEFLPPIGFPEDFKQYTSEIVEAYPVRLWTDRDQATSTDSWADHIHTDYQVDKIRFSDLVESDAFLRNWESRFFNEQNGDEHVLREQDLVLLPTRLLAYVFRERKFALLSLYNLRKCRNDVDGFENLKLLKGYKKMVKSLVMTHFMKKKISSHIGRHDALGFDVVYAKSRGLVFLLHGVPGVGKTSTAECVAEATGKPLFPITCGDLGLTPERVEKTLRETFHLAQLWDCVLLLDEADIFLAQRTKTDLKRNALVSVFLRVLEYYSGILFLTTNRVGVIDEAFKSRIHVTLLYPELTQRQTKLIWKMNLERLRKIDKERTEKSTDPEMLIDEEEIMAFQERHYRESRERNRTWNGRQIRNAFQTASALALFDAHQATINRIDERSDVEKAQPILKVEYFEKVEKASSDFDMYIAETAGIGGKNEGERARDRGERADYLHYTAHGGRIEPLDQYTELRPSQPRRQSTAAHGRPHMSNPRYSSVPMGMQDQVPSRNAMPFAPSSAPSGIYDPHPIGHQMGMGLHEFPPEYSRGRSGSQESSFPTGCVPMEASMAHMPRQSPYNLDDDEDDDDD